MCIRDRTVLTTVLRTPASDPETLAEIDRQLDGAYDLLNKALSYAEQKDPRVTLPIKAHLALIGAMKRGGREFARAHMKSLMDAAKGLRLYRESLALREKDLIARAGEEHRKMELSAEMDLGWLGHGISPGQRAAGIHARLAGGLREDAESVKRERAELADAPEKIEEFCRFLEPILANRTLLLRRAP